MRLGLVLDPRNPPDRLREIARMAEGAGIEALWTRDELPASDPLRLEAWTAITLAAGETRTPAIGASVSATLRTPEALVQMASTLDAASGGRLELTIAAAVDDQADDVERYLGAIRDRLREAAVGVGPDPRAELHPDVSSPRLAVEVVGRATAGSAARLADDAVIVLRPGRDLSPLLSTVRDACSQEGRPPGTLGVAVELPVSVGRTTAEAHARAAAEALFQITGSPAELGVFGTLEQCQERAIALAHQGVTDLRCVIPNSPDIHDVIAQLTAITVGTTDVLAPGAPRSPDPGPPATWGGRSVARPE